MGRPFSTEKGYLTSAVLPLSRPELNISNPEPVMLLPDEQQTLAASHWSRVAMIEHASVASFARFSMQLMSVGAPLDLLQLAHQAAQDEVKHTKIAILFASKFAKSDIALGEFPVSAEHLSFGDIGEAAEATAAEGCIEETIAALVARVVAEAVIPDMQAPLRDVAQEEASHAALAWRSLQWMLEKSPSIRARVAQVFADYPRPAPVAASSRTPLEDVGILPAEKTEALRFVGWNRIVVPLASSLGLLQACEETTSEQSHDAAHIRAVIADSLRTI
jgi:hypothetical protein